MWSTLGGISLLLICALAAFAAANQVVGKWSCTSKDDSGAELSWTLLLKEDGGKLAGSLNGSPGDVPLLEPKLEGDTLTFAIDINSNCRAGFKTKIEGNKIDGTFSCPEVQGTFKGVKK